MVDSHAPLTPTYPPTYPPTFLSQVGSHRWGDGRVGSANQFFDTDRKGLLRDAARREGLDPTSLEIRRLAVRCGGVGIHDGRLWHGSGANTTRDKPRRGLGIHFIPADARFRDASADCTLAHQWKGTDDELPAEHFPVVWQRGADSCDYK